MEGQWEPSELRGIIPRTFCHIFDQIEDTHEQNFLVRASYLEIYNEEVRDLLSKDPKNKLELKEDVDRGVYVKDLTSYVVKAITGGTDAQGEVSVGVEYKGLHVVGRGAHTDIVIASAMAFVNALNRLDVRTGAISHMMPVRAVVGGV